jgi:CheY-like chemotaxis protein
VREFVQTFLGSTQHLLDQVRMASEDGNAAALAKHASALKNLSREVGAATMQEVCVTIQTLASSGSHETAKDYMGALSLAFERVAADLREAEVDLSSLVALNAAVSGGGNVAHKPQRGRRILVGEGNALLAKFLTTTLSAGGFEVCLARSGREALELLRHQSLDMAVLDASLPEGDGYFVLAEVRIDPKLGRMPVMILSDKTQEQEVLRAFELGADDYVPTPFNPLEVSARVRSLLRRS